MPTVYNTFENLSIFASIQQLKKIEIKRNFKEEIKIKFNDYHFCLSRFADARPLKYHNKSLIVQLYNFLSPNSIFFLDSLCEKSDVINNSIFSLLRIGSSWTNENNIDISTPKNIEEFEAIWHPQYLRYFEAIYKKLLEPIILTVDKKHSSNLIKTNEKNQITKLLELNLNELLKGNNRAIRNAISHGKVKYDNSQIIYEDKNETEALFPSDFLMLFDDLVETCNSIVITFLLIISELCATNKRVSKKLPLCFHYLLFDGLFSSDHFKLLSLRDSTVNNKTQLNIIFQLNSISRSTQALYSINLCYNILKYTNINYGKFAINIDCGKPVSAALFINGEKLQNAIKKNLTIEDSLDIIESNLLWYNTSNIKSRIDNFKYIAKTQYKIYKIQRKKELRNAGFKLFKERYEIKDIENRSTGNIARIYAFVLIKDIDDLDYDGFHKLIKYITNHLHRQKFQCISFEGKTFFKKHPKYIWIDFFSKDRSIRFYKRHQNYSFFILKSEWISNSKKNPVILIKNPDSIIENIRYKYNKNSEILKIYEDSKTEITQNIIVS